MTQETIQLIAMVGVILILVIATIGFVIACVEGVLFMCRTLKKWRIGYNASSTGFDKARWETAWWLKDTSRLRR